MPEPIKTLIEFLAEWFNHFDKKEVKVKVSNPTNLRSLESQLEDVKKSISKLGKFLSDIKEVIEEIEIPKPLEEISIKNFPEKEIQKVEVANFPEFPEQKFPEEIKISNLDEIKIPVPKEVKIPEFPKFPNIKIPDEVKVSNLPEVQKVEGAVIVREFGELLKGIQFLIDNMNELKIEIPAAIRGTQTGGTVVASTMGSHKEKVPGDVRYDPSDSRPDYIGTHENPDAPTNDSDWIITKYTYDGSTSNATRTVTRRGSWDGRASLFT